MSATKSTSMNTNNTKPVFEHSDTLYVFIGEYVKGNINNYAWTSWKKIKDIYRFILPHKIKDFALYNSFKEVITIINVDNRNEKYILNPKEVTIIKKINFDLCYEITKSSGKIGKLKFCITSSQGALSVTTTDKDGVFEDNWNKIISDKSSWTEGIDVFSHKDAKTGDVLCTEASRIKTFKGRGNSTWKLDKKSFKIKFYKQKSCLGMDKTNSLCLMANYQDGTLMRNKFMYDMAHQAEILSPDSRYLDLYVNGSYKGAYQLSEAYKLGKNKLVKVRDLEDETFKRAQKVRKSPNFDVYATYANKAYYVTSNYNDGIIQYYDIPIQYNPNNITGGYLIQINVINNADALASTFTTPKGQFVEVLSPEFCTEAQIKYIYDYFVHIETSFYNQNNDYSDLIDIESFAKTYIVQELSKNIDGGVTSTFFYKDKGKRMYAGPVWDYDCALGNLIGSRADEYGREYDTNQPTGWFTKKIAIPENKDEINIYTAACQIEDIWKTIQSVWKRDFMDVIDIAVGKKPPSGSRLKSIKYYEKMLLDAAHVNYLVYPSPCDFPWIACKEPTFEGQIKYVIDWLTNRQKWLNNKIPNSTTDYFVYLKQKRGWKPTAHFWTDKEESTEDTWPGGFMRCMGDSIYCITVSGDANRIIFSDNGSNQTPDLVIPERNMVYDLDTEEWSLL